MKWMFGQLKPNCADISCLILKMNSQFNHIPKWTGIDYISISLSDNLTYKHVFKDKSSIFALNNNINFVDYVDIVLFLLKVCTII